MAKKPNSNPITVVLSDAANDLLRKQLRKKGDIRKIFEELLFEKYGKTAQVEAPT